MKLEYTWEELKPIHPLSYTVFAFQGLGACLSLLLEGLEHWYQTAWQGGAVGTLVGFLAGMIVQSHLRPGSLAENRGMVSLCGFIAFALFLAGLFFFR